MKFLKKTKEKILNKVRNEIESARKEMREEMKDIREMTGNLARCLNQIARLEMNVSSRNPTTPYYQELLYYTDKILNSFPVFSMGDKLNKTFRIGYDFLHRRL